jgi:hypothetical protein
MKYIFELSSSVELAANVYQKHERVIKGLISIREPWGIMPGSYPVPSFGRGIIGTFQISKLLGKGIKGDIMYRFRNQTKKSDVDRVYIQFSPEKIDYNFFLNTIIYEYINFFDADHGLVCEERLLFYDNEKFRETYSRFYSFRFSPVNFWSDEFCIQQIGVSIIELSNLINKEVAKVEIINEKILIVVSFDVLNFDEANSIDLRLKSLLGIFE